MLSTHIEGMKYKLEKAENVEDLKKRIQDLEG
jgi:hypothetical protein